MTTVWNGKRPSSLDQRSQCSLSEGKAISVKGDYILGT